MPFLHRNVDLFFTVEKSFTIYTDISFIRCHDAGDTAERHAFSAAGSAQKRQCLIAGVKFHIQLKSAEIFLYFHIQ